MKGEMSGSAENNAETTRSDLSEVEARVEKAAEDSAVIEYPILDVHPRNDPDGGVLAKNPYEWEVRCSGVALTESDENHLTAYRLLEVMSVHTAGSRGPGVIVRLRYKPE